MYTLILLVCIPGAWSHCSNGIDKVKIEGIVSIEACEKAAETFKRRERLYRSHVCVEQQPPKEK